MNLIAVDLAARFSAAVWMNEYRVIRQWDSWQKTESEFLSLFTNTFLGMGAPIPEALVIEDLPARVPWMGNVKDVCRLQGRIIEQMSGVDALERVLFVQPATWQEHFGLKRGAGPEAVVPEAARFGYTAPDLSHRCRINERTDKPLAADRHTAAKVTTDYCAAYLIARWATDFYREHHHLNAVRTSRYHPKA